MRQLATAHWHWQGTELRGPQVLARQEIDIAGAKQRAEALR